LPPFLHARSCGHPALYRYDREPRRAWSRHAPLAGRDGQFITPLAAPGARIDALHTDLRSDDNANAANAVTSALSPDGSTLLILTSGFNNSFFREDGTPIVYPILDSTTGLPTGQTTSNAEWVFVYDVAGPVPVQTQKINLPVTYNGLAWDPRGNRFYVSGGADDIVYPFEKVNGAFQLDPHSSCSRRGGGRWTIRTLDR
jgi:hypothetical protein